MAETKEIKSAKENNATTLGYHFILAKAPIVSGDLIKRL